jgi:hypothetical protein
MRNKQVSCVDEKIRFTLEQTQSGRGIAVLLSLTSTLDGVGGQLHAPTTLPPGKENPPPPPLPGFDRRTVQPVGSHQTYYAIPIHVQYRILCYNRWYV